MSRRSAEQAGLQAQLRAEQSTEKLTVMEPEKALADLGGIAEILRKAAPALKGASMLRRVCGSRRPLAQEGQGHRRSRTCPEGDLNPHAPKGTSTSS